MAVKNEGNLVWLIALKIWMKSFNMSLLHELLAGRQFAPLHLVFTEILWVEALQPFGKLL